MGRVSRASATVEASPGRVWAALVDVEDWPRWTPSMTSVRRLDDGPLRVGSAARIEQPGLRPLVWTVCELTAERSFSWVTRLPGLRITGVHTITPLPDGRARLDLAAIGTGPLARLADLLGGRRTRRYVELEAAGTKAAAEADPDAPTR